MGSNRSLRLVSLVLSGAGILDAAYLTWVKLTHTQVYCGVLGDCQTVNTSPYSEIGGIPIALLGLGGYALISVLLILESRGEYWEVNAPLWIFGLSLVGVIYSAYLTYVELAILHAICVYCAGSAILMVALFIISIFRVVSGPGEVSYEESRGGD
jgi:uncharacterized membrane protein